MITHHAFQRGAAWRLAAALLVAGFLVNACDSKNNNGMGPDAEPEPELQNRAPMANAGPDQTVSATIAVRLDGNSSSDADGDEITYLWSFTSMPQGSGASLDDNTMAEPSFVPDVAGDYVLQLVVNDGSEDSSPDNVTITAENNTQSATIGTNGGDVTSDDGEFTLSIPPGALSEDTDITITRITADQYPDDLEDLSDDGAVYQLGPDGLQFTAPTTVNIGLPNQNSNLESDLYLLFAIAGDGTPELLNNQSITIDAAADEVTLSGELEHFSTLVRGPATLKDDAGVLLSPIGVLVSDVPDVVFVGQVFEVIVNVVSSLPLSSAELSSEQTDASGPLIEPLSFDGTFIDVGTTSAELKSSNDYHCTAVGRGTWGTVVLVGVVIPDGRGWLFDKVAPNVREATVQYTFKKDIDCIEPDDDPPPPPPPPEEWIPLPAALPEAASLLFKLAEPGAAPSWGAAAAANSPEDGDMLGLARLGGGTITDVNGAVIAELDGVDAAHTSFGSVGLEASGLDRTVMIFSSGGIYRTNAAIPDTPADPAPSIGLELADLTITDITNNDGNTTDGIPFGNDPSTDGWVFTQFEDRNVLFVVSGASDFEVDQDLSNAFYDNGTSIFGDDRPISVFVGPNGFTENDPMLALTIADDGSGDGKIVKLDLENGLAVPTVPTELFVNGEPRRIRCLDVDGTYFCAASAFGANGGFGGVTFFTWDGQDGFTFIINRITTAIGIDLIRDGDRMLVASTNFAESTYAIDELTTDGSYVTFETFDVSADCQGPGHVLFRSTTEVILSCNTNGMVISHVFDEGS